MKTISQINERKGRKEKEKDKMFIHGLI